MKLCLKSNDIFPCQELLHYCFKDLNLIQLGANLYVFARARKAWHAFCQSMFSVFNSRKSFFVSKKIVHCKNFEQNNRQKVINLRRRLSRSLACVPCSDFDGDALFFSPQRLSAPQRAVRNFAPPTFARSPRARSRPIGCSVGPLGVARLRALRKNELTGGGKYVVDTM